MSAGSTMRGADQVAVALEAPTIEEAVDEKKKIHEKVEKHVDEKAELKGGGISGESGRKTEKDTKPKDRAEKVAEQVEASTELELAVHHENPLDLKIETKEDTKATNATQIQGLEASSAKGKPPGKSLLSWESGIFDHWIPGLAWNSLYFALRLRRRSTPVNMSPHGSVTELQPVSPQPPFNSSPCACSHNRHIFPARSHVTPSQQTQPPHM